MDYRSFSDKPEPKKTTTADAQWWKRSGDEAASSITATLEAIRKLQDYRLTQQAISTRLYGNVAMLGMNGVSLARMASAMPTLRDRISYNVISSCVDTVTAKIGKNKPKPLFLTSGGDYKIQRKAKKLNQFIDGVFYENHAHRLGVDAFRDGCVWGTGATKVFAQNGRVKYERTLSGEIYVDELEGFYGEPRQMHHVKNVDRAVLMDAFPGQAKLIQGVDGARLDDSAGQANVSDLVTVRESWHLPSGPDAADGKHLITLENGVLRAEDYEKPFFPFAFFHWSKRMYGFWGQGLAEQLQNIQLEINKLLWVIQRSMHLAGSFKVLCENGSKIVKEHQNNDIGALVMYSGTPPQYVVPPVVPPEIYQHLATLKTQAFEQSGISQLSAASQKPAGLDSGKALREFNDIESDRFTTVGHAYENYFLDLARLSISVVKDITSEKGKRSYEVKVPSKNFIQTIDWKDVDLEEDDFVMQCYPVSSLPNEPAGRMQTVQEWVQAGWISPRQGRKLMDFPDLEMAEGLANAAEEWLTQVLDKIVDEGVFTPPEPFDDLQLARELALEYYARGKCQNLEPERLEMLDRFMVQLDALEQTAAQAMPAPGGAPGAAPEAPPVSDLIPNAPAASPTLQ